MPWLQLSFHSDYSECTFRSLGCIQDSKVGLVGVYPSVWSISEKRKKQSRKVGNRGPKSSSAIIYLDALSCHSNFLDWCYRVKLESISLSSFFSHWSFLNLVIVPFLLVTLGTIPKFSNLLVKEDENQFLFLLSIVRYLYYYETPLK